MLPIQRTKEIKTTIVFVLSRENGGLFHANADVSCSRSKLLFNQQSNMSECNGHEASRIYFQTKLIRSILFRTETPAFYYSRRKLQKTKIPKHSRQYD